MTPSEAVLLTRYVKACCPQQQIDDYTPDAWFDLLGDLSLADCRVAVKEVGKRQPFVAPAEIRAEVKRVRNDRLAREIIPRLPAEPGPYKAALEASVREIADGLSVRKAIGGPVRDDDPPPTWAEARAKMAAPRELTPQEKARHQAAESRAAREARSEDEDPAA